LVKADGTQFADCGTPQHFWRPTYSNHGDKIIHSKATKVTKTDNLEQEEAEITELGYLRLLASVDRDKPPFPLLPPVQMSASVTLVDFLRKAFFV
jgi:hypothetical protein